MPRYTDNSFTSAVVINFELVVTLVKKDMKSNSNYISIKKQIDNIAHPKNGKNYLWKKLNLLNLGSLTIKIQDKYIVCAVLC